MNDVPAMDPARILVTGSSGLVGRHFRAHCGGIPLADANGRVDLRDRERVRSAVAAIQPQAVLHLAAQSSVAHSFEDPSSTMEVNYFGTSHLLEALRSTGFSGTFLYVGSADVYGRMKDEDLPARETQPLRPRSPYAVSKVAAEALCYQWSQTERFRIVLARPFNQIGPGQNPRFAVASFARQIAGIAGGKEPTVTTGDLDITRDFTDVRDTVRAYRRLIEAGENGEIYNLCSGKERSLRSILHRMLEISGVRAEIQVDSSRLRPGEQRRMVGDPGKIRNAIGWSAEIPIDTTLTDILQQAKENCE